MFPWVETHGYRNGRSYGTVTMMGWGFTANLEVLGKETSADVFFKTLRVLRCLKVWLFFVLIYVVLFFSHKLHKLTQIVSFWFMLGCFLATGYTD
jgi:hypothetical protein